MTRMFIIGVSALMTLSLGLSGCATTSGLTNSGGAVEGQTNNIEDQNSRNRRFASDGPVERFSEFSGGGGAALIK